MEVDTQTYATRIGQAFDGRASMYDQNDTYHPALAEMVLQLAAPAPGDTVLDLACGTGLAALKAAEAVGPQGRVVGMDLSEGMLQKARAKSAELGLANMEWLQGNMEEASFPAASFHVITCCSAILFVQDLPATLQKWRGWLRPEGGRLVFNSFLVPPGALVDYKAFIQVACEFGLHIEDPCNSLGNEQQIQAVLQGAGFKHIKVNAEARERTFPADSPAAFAEMAFGLFCSLNPRHEPFNEEVMPGAFEQFKAECIACITADAATRFTPGKGVSTPYTALAVLAYA